MFELKLNNTTIQLYWGTWSMREFCKAKDITIDKYFEFLGSNQYDIDNIVKLIHIGYKSACINNKKDIEFTEDDVCNWIDEIGGIFNPEGQILLYLKYIVANTVTTIQGVPKEEKKKPSKVRMG